MTLVKPVGKRLIAMVHAMVRAWCVHGACDAEPVCFAGGQRIMAMNIKQFIASKPAPMVCTVH